MAEPEGEVEVSPPAKRGFLRYNSPLAQVSLLGLICFCCPGMFNALSGLGGGGQLDHTTADNANTALYACFAVFGVLGGAAHNLLGPRRTLLLGALTYPLYAASFLYYNHRHSQAFPVAAGAILGAGAGFLWAAQGAIMTSYPPPNRRGTYISLFWCLFNLGGVLGGLLPFSFNYHRGNDAASVNDGTYIAFMAFMLLGAALTLLVLPPRRIVRDDGTKATRVTYSSPATEFAEILALFANWKMLLVLPAAWASNFFYTYQFNNVNGVLFTLRTKGLNNVFYWGAQMLGSAGIGYFLDFGFASRRKRGLVGVAAVAVLGTAIWGGGLANQFRYTDGKWEHLIDFKDGRRYAGPFLLYFSYGLLDAMFQSLIYWIIGALANDSQILSRYVGFYKGVQSAGAAVAWQVDTHKTSLISQLIVNWALMTVSYPLLALLVFLAVKDEDNSVSSVEDGKDRDSKLSAPTSFH
ncbi:UNC93-like protein 1 [Phragmites australis]|uniref:UNC93-like protein 1 n=1 Tax=Phragmites australis TaxID=29695 RepID=UPI002D79AD7E|nr:UNC93-like protein 1 [Phragmites australis]